MIGFLMDFVRHSQRGRMVRLDHEEGYAEAFIWLSKPLWEDLGKPRTIEVELRPFELPEKDQQ